MSLGLGLRMEVSDLKIDKAHNVLPMFSISKAG